MSELRERHLDTPPQTRRPSVSEQLDAICARAIDVNTADPTPR